MGVEDWVRKGIGSVEPARYPNAEAGFLRMDANTNLCGLNPVVEKVARQVSEIELNHYATPFSDPLREALAVTCKVGLDNLIIGNGSDEVLDMVTKAFLNPGEVVALATPSFVMQKIFVLMNLGRPAEVPLTRPAFDLDVEAILALNAKLTIIASPNNPTANTFSPGAIDRLISGSKGLVLLDEAYAEFSGQNYLPRAATAENLVVSRTFSKAYGLAGLRVGYAVGPKEIVSRLYAVKVPFSVNTLGERIAIEALRDPAFMQASVRLICEEREKLASSLKGLGLRPCATDANFMLVDIGRESEPVRQEIRKRGILVRHMSDFPGLESYIRFTVGRPEHNAAFLTALKEALKA